MSLTKVSYSMIQGAPINAFDYMTPAQIADVQAGTMLEDVTAALQAALVVAKAGNGAVVYLPAGVYKVSDTLDITPTYSASPSEPFKNLQTSVGFKGDGQHSTWIAWASTVQPTVARKAVVS